jgi:CDP-glucose 4,6-dehydratase
VITTDKVYANSGAGNRFVEDDPLGGGDPYSNSKACVELVVRSWIDSYSDFPLATARAGNVIGGGDWSVDRIVPDVVRAIEAEAPVVLRFPDGIRPWQFVLEPLSGYLAQAQRLAEAPGECPRALNFGPDASSEARVADLVERLHALLGAGEWTRDTGANPHEAAALRLDNQRAAETLKWVPRLSLDEALAWTAEWYRAELEGNGELRVLAAAQIEAFEQLA